MSLKTIKSKKSIKCPSCGGYNIANLHGKWVRCLDCSEKFKVSRGIVNSIIDKDEYGKRRERSKKYRKNKFLARQSAILKNSQTVTEGEFGKRLQEAEIEFIPQWTYNVEGFAGIVDFYLPKYRLVLEVDGGYHLEEDQKLKDMEKHFICRKVLRKKVLRLTNKQALSLQMSEIMSLINKAI
jgi:very-short-patch-repair endonuclease